MTQPMLVTVVAAIFGALAAATIIVGFVAAKRLSGARRENPAGRLAAIREAFSGYGFHVSIAAAGDGWEALEFESHLAAAMEKCGLKVVSRGEETEPFSTVADASIEVRGVFWKEREGQGRSIIVLNAMSRKGGIVAEGFLSGTNLDDLVFRTILCLGRSVSK